MGAANPEAWELQEQEERLGRGSGRGSEVGGRRWGGWEEFEEGGGWVWDLRVGKEV